MEDECRKVVDNPQRGKNIFVVGILSCMYSRDLDIVRQEIAKKFKKKGDKVIQSNLALLDAGYEWAQEHLDLRYEIPAPGVSQAQLVMNGNTAVALGTVASGMEVCAMYPITPATSASHYLSEIFEDVGGVIHQAEDEIAACAFAIGASYAGKCADDNYLRPWHGLEIGAAGLVRHGGNPAGGGGRATGWPQHRSADQGRTG